MKGAFNDGKPTMTMEWEFGNKVLDQAKLFNTQKSIIERAEPYLAAFLEKKEKDFKEGIVAFGISNIRGILSDIKALRENIV